MNTASVLRAWKLGICSLLIGPVVDPDKAVGAGAPAFPTSVVDARIVTSLRPEVRRSLLHGLALATMRLRSHDDCRALFARYGGNGLDALARTFYYPASGDEEERYCEMGHATAYTRVGGTHTGLCRSFGSLSRVKAAATLIHEALHSAGMSERPHDPDGFSSLEIDRLVKNRCSL